MAISATYRGQEFNELNNEIIRLAATGMPLEEIAESLGQSVTSVAYIVRSPLGQKQLEVAQHSQESTAIAPLTYIRNKAPEILAIYEGLIRDKAASASVRMKACQDWLDRANIVPTRGSAEEGIATKSVIDSIKKRAFEAGVVRMYEQEQEEEDKGEKEAVSL